MITLIFFSSDEISLPLLRSLAEDKNFQIKAVFCQPDKPADRKMNMRSPATKILAESYGLKVYQPEDLNKAEDLLNEFSGEVDFIVTFAYGKILNEKWLQVPKIAPLNVHTSLLPKYRGASPIQSAILNGDLESGYSLIKMEKKMDAGPIAFKHEIQIDKNASHEDLAELMANEVAKNLPKQIIAIKENPIFEEQEGEATYCSKIKKEDAELDFKENADVIYNKFRAYKNWPGIWTLFKGKRLKLLQIKVEQKDLPTGKIQVENGEIFIGTVKNSIKVLELQMEGKKAMPAKDFLLGQSDFSESQVPS